MAKAHFIKAKDLPDAVRLLSEYGEKARILANDPMAGAYRILRLECSDHFGRARPGQFVMLAVGTGPTPLLRRPFSIHRLQPGVPQRAVVEILYKVVGEGDDRLSARELATALGIVPGTPLGT